jgi:hypothetical protein
MKAHRLYPNARKRWYDNWDAFNSNPDAYFEDIVQILKKKYPRYFRWHSAGEIPNQRYFDGMVMVANALPDIKFMVFTKRYKIDISSCPDNLQVIFSTWPKVRIPSYIKDRVLAWMDDGSQSKRIRQHDKTPIVCKGSCEGCWVCWRLSEIGRDVVFAKH